MSAPRYDDQPPPYECDQTSGKIIQHDLNPSAPAYHKIADESVNNEGMKTDKNIPIANEPEATSVTSRLPQRSIYVVKMHTNEPTPIITVITPDLIPQYQNEHIVYPINENGTSNIQIIQPNVLTSNTVSLFDTQVRTQKQKALYDPVPTYDVDNNIDFSNSSKTMVAHDHQPSNVRHGKLCGSSHFINYNKRIPTELPNKYNLMYGRINLLISLMFWVIFIMIQIDNERNTSTTIIEYCYTQYPEPRRIQLSDASSYSSRSCPTSATDYMACNKDPVCFVMHHVYAEPNCYHESENCQCCADTFSGVYIAFYVFLAIDTFRLILGVVFGLSSIGNLNGKAKKTMNRLYLIDPDTNKVKLQEYMNFLCDHPSSYLIGIFYSEAGHAITDGIIYNIAFPTTKFLYLNIILLYIPFFTLIGIITSAQINILDPGYTYPTMYPTYSPTPRPTYYGETATVTTEAPVTYELKSLLITCIVGLVLLGIGFIMHIYRWRKKNIIERENLKIKAEAEEKEIVVGPQSAYQCPIPCCGFKTLDENARTPSDTQNKFNLVFGWINLIIFVYIWVLFGIGLHEYGWFIGDSSACIAYIVFMAFNTMRLMGITVITGIKHVDNEYNYIINNHNGKVKLRYFMDYLCDHPAGFIVGFLYPDVQKALNEGLIYNITFPEVPFLFANIIIFYFPIMIISSVQASNEFVSTYHENLEMLYIIAAVGCGVGIVSNAYRFKMKNDIDVCCSF